MMTGGAGLAATTGGRRWLANFDEDDRNSAQLLLESIAVVSDHQFRHDMRQLLARIAEGSRGRPIAAVAIFGLPPDLGPHFFECATAHAGEQFDSPCPPSGKPGSELLVRHILSKSSKKLGLLVAPSVADMKEKRVSRLLLVTDTLVSGDEAGRFAAYIYANKTIKSWHSYKRIEIEIVAHSVSELALRNLGSKYRVHYEQIARTFDTAGWNRAQKASVELLCARYASRSGTDVMGWGGARSLQIYAHTFGNGTPLILRQTAGPRSSPWHSLIRSGRDFGLAEEDARVAEGYYPAQSLSDRLASLVTTTRKRLAPTLAAAYAIEAEARPVRGEHSLLAMLAAVAAGHDRPHAIMNAASMSASRYQYALAFALRFHLVSCTGEVLTTAGFAGPVRDGQSGRVALTAHGRKVMRRLELRGARNKMAAGGAASAGETHGTALPVREVKHDGRAKTIETEASSTYYPESLR